MASIQMIGFGEASPPKDEIVDNNFVLNLLRQAGLNLVSQSGEEITAQGVEERVGIKTRWLSRLGSNLDSTALALEASFEALEDAHKRTGGVFSKEKLGLIHSGGSSRQRNDPNFSDYPACANKLQGLLGLTKGQVEARDISLACTSWVDGLVLAGARMKDADIRYGLVAVGEAIGSRYNAPTSLNFTLWGDGGGAVVLKYQPAGDCHYGLLCGRNYSDGAKSDWTRQINEPVPDSSMEGHERDIHRYGMIEVADMVRDFISDVSDEFLSYSDEKRIYLLPHNANLRMINGLGERALGLPPERILHSLAERGNTSSASIPITLRRYVKEGLFKKDDLLLMVAFGGGMSVCIALYRWP